MSSESPDYDERGMTRRQALRAGASVMTAGGLAGCGSDGNDTDTDYDGDDTDTGTDGDSEPRLEDVEVFLKGETPETVDFTEQEVLETGYNPTLRLTYSNGETEEVDIDEEDYEVTDAYSKRTNGEDFYGADYGKNGLPNSFEVEFDDELLQKAGFYQEIDDVEQLDSSQLLAGLNEVGFTLDVDQSALQNYTEANLEDQEIDTEIQVQDTVEAVKTEQQYIQDHLPTEENTVELWKEFRGYVTDISMTGPTEGTIPELETNRDLSERIMSAVDTSADDKEMLRQISDEWTGIAGSATGSTPSTETGTLSDIIDENTDLVPFPVANLQYTTVAVYQPDEGNILHVASNPPVGQAEYEVEDLVGFEDNSVTSQSPILNPEFDRNNKTSAQASINALYDMDNEFTKAMLADLDSSVSFMDDIRANDGPGENVEAVREGIETNLRAAVANVMRDDADTIFRGIKEGDGWSVETADASNFNLREDF
jgi:hypothetical protein